MSVERETKRACFAHSGKDVGVTLKREYGK
jgi:hypothetical protein